MKNLFIRLSAALFLVALVVTVTASTAAQTPNEQLATVNLPRAVLANGQPLAAGTYTLRLTGKLADPVSGQTPEASPWVEFVQGGQVKGREVAIVVTAADAPTVLKGPGPRDGSAQVEMLQGNEYLRIWVNHGGTHYLFHLPVK